MHYLEDDIDLLEGVPDEVKRQCYQIRELDVRTERALMDVRNESRAFFNALASLNGEERAKRCKKIKEAYKLIREMSEEKLAIAEFLELMLEKYQERIAKDLNEFKLELELDSPGITTSIENELCTTLKSVHSLKRPFKMSSEAGSGIGDDSGYEEQKYSLSTPRVKHGSGTSVTDSNSEYFSDQKRFPPFCPTPKSKSASRKHSRVPSLNLSASSAEQQREKRHKLATEDANSPSPAHSSKSAYGGDFSEVVDMEAASSSEGYASTTQRYTYQRTPFNGGGSIASSSTSTTPSPPITNANSSILCPNGSFGRSALPPSQSCSNNNGYASSSQPAGTAGIMPSFASGQESQYGRPVKLTTRVQQMLKDRQSNRGHRANPMMSPNPHGTDGQLSAADRSTPRNSVSRDTVNDDELEMSEDEADSSMSGNEQEIAIDEEEEDESEDQDNHVWCICQQKSEGDMVACDNKKCPYEWFHYECVGITAPPRGKWYCPTCSKNLRRSRSMESR